MGLTQKLDHGQLLITWFEDTKELGLTFYNDDNEIEEQFLLDEKTSYDLLNLLKEKFEKIRKLSKVILKTSDTNK